MRVIYTIAAYKKQDLSYIARNRCAYDRIYRLSKSTNTCGQDAVNQDVIRVLLSSNIIKSCTLLKRTGARARL